MRRREFITLVGGGAAAWPLMARAQQPKLPVIGVLYAGKADEVADKLAAFRRTLNEAGYIEGRNVAFEYRYAEGNYDKLSGLAAELARNATSTNLLQVSADCRWEGLQSSQTRSLSALGALSARYATPAIFQQREFVASGGLLSYGSDVIDSYRLAATYAVRVLKGEKPADLPVQRATKVELIVNLKTAKALGISVPTSILVRADEVIE
jgi:ABC-type uncharacterized transport system substrate-binding protein